MSSRKEFLAAGSLFALLPSPVAGTKKAKPAPASQPKLTFSFDRNRFQKILFKPARHKQCFGATSIQGGDVLEAMNNSIEAYDDFLAEGRGAMQAVAVLYHGASIAMAMSDTIWNELLIPSLSRLPSNVTSDIGSVKRNAGNPYLRSTTSDPQDVSIESLAAKGSSFFVCHNALIGFSYMLSQAAKIGLRIAHRRLLAGIVPQALVVPAGVMAINAAQEARFTYIQASLSV
jgi:intracellular sulfur oxidation DsrE/DsrF family protein